ncbi:hypothetical protein [Streptomyces sp. UNOC14_S4]|uniref:hypothetical protein n=1 Tax=Streptomyces sp. UNOC14_S4 TaxID=2872340 RepID=UPI001E5A10C2|nr:hypothetical protein [Streptomyces sp. UNOC14_S4]MCC3766465.1 hypothetical protein [Streptomyces sp. UNOC14_S4]
MDDRISITITGHGDYQTRAGALDLMICTYLPASVDQLRQKIVEMTGEGCEGHESLDGTIGNVVFCDGSCVAAYRNLKTFTECLMVLAELNGHATN